MARRDGAWLLHLELEDGSTLEASTDDLTLDELEVAERVSGVAWAALNPLRSAKVAKGLLALLLIRQNLATGMDRGTAEAKALEVAGQVTARQLSDAFTYQPPTEGFPELDGERSADPPSPAPTSSAG
jgi:hypothetical protein